MSYLTQMLGLTVQNFVSAAAGLAVLAALIRGFRRRPTQIAGQEKAGSHGEGLIGNFWVDLTRSTLYILLPLSIVLAVCPWSRKESCRTFAPTKRRSSCSRRKTPKASRSPSKRCRWDPPHRKSRSSNWAPTAAGSSTSIRRIRTKTPRRWRTSSSCLAILIISAALCYTFGVMVGDTRQGWAILAAMLVIFIPLFLFVRSAGRIGNPRLRCARC